MGMQIEKVVLWRAGNAGEKVEYDFAPGMLNIILGGHACGKTTFIKIIDYVLGGDISRIDAHIEDALSWIGVILLTSSTRHLFARAVPNPGRSKSQRCRHEEIPLNEDYTVPADLEPNITDENVRKLLTAIVCGRPVTVAEGEKASLPFFVPKSISLQGYATITNEAQLFDNLDTKTGAKWLPFVLGIERQAQIDLKLELEEKKSTKANLNRELSIIKNVIGNWTVDLQAKIRQARALSLYTPKSPDKDVPANIEQLLIEAKLLLESTKGKIVLPANDEKAHEQSVTAIRNLMAEADSISYTIGILQGKLKQLDDIAASLAKFTDAAQKTSDRLELVRWLKKKWNPDQGTFFNVCDTVTEQEAKEVLASIMKALETYENSIINKDKRKNVDRQIDKRRSMLRSRIAKEETRLAQKNELIRRHCQANKAADDALKYQQCIFDLIGEIKAIVQLAHATGGRDIEVRLATLTAEIATLEERCKKGVGEEQERRNSYLSSIANRTHVLLQDLHVSQQQKASSIEFDIDKVDLILNSSTGPTRLSKESASSYHIAFHVALTCAIAEHIVKNAEAAGLGFVIYDEPSRSEEVGSTDKRSEEAGFGVYQTLLKSVEYASQGWQPIVIDTATKASACKGLPKEKINVIEFETGKGILPDDWMKE